jgi:hypothetical protein
MPLQDWQTSGDALKTSGNLKDLPSVAELARPP